MILTCSSCASRFEIDLAQLGAGGRKVRCGHCGHTWHQTPEPPAAVDGEPDKISGPIPRLQEFDDERRRSAEREADEPVKGDKRRLAAHWLLFVLVVALIGLGLVYGKDKIVQAVPEAAKLYRLAGVEVDLMRPGEGLELRDVTHVLSLDGGQNMLLVEGTIVNVSDQPRPISTLRATITDETEQEVDSWTFEVDAEILAPGAETAFRTSTKDPPKNGNLTLGFEQNQP